jgi:MoaA/NifB/PqqE/SkfB family radical SAM enzyme
MHFSVCYLPRERARARRIGLCLEPHVANWVLTLVCLETRRGDSDYNRGIGAEERRLSAQLLIDHPTDGPRLDRLPLVTLYLTERCNSRCVSCDYWQHGRDDMNLGAVARLLPNLAQLHTQVALLSGGEPLLNPEWAPIAELLRARGLKVWLLTSGLSLAKNARRAAAVFDAITVSLDGTDPATYAKIRGLDAFEKVCEGIRLVVAEGLRPTIRVTVQRANFVQLASFVSLAKQLGAREVSFLAVDVATPLAFGRRDEFATDLSLKVEDLPVFERILSELEVSHADDFHRGLIAETPQKLRRILQYFAAIRGQGLYPRIRCNAPEFSAVVGANGRVQPCFFIPGPANASIAPRADGDKTLAGELNGQDMSALRRSIRRGERQECKTCVCSLWRNPDNFENAVRSMVCGSLVAP